MELGLRLALAYSVTWLGSHHSCTPH